MKKILMLLALAGVNLLLQRNKLRLRDTKLSRYKTNIK